MQKTVFFFRDPFLQCRKQYFFSGTHFSIAENSIFFQKPISAMQETLFFSRTHFCNAGNEVRRTSI
jgi:hypothetical protein